LKRLRHALTWFKLRSYFSRLLRAFQACTVASEQERHLLKNVFPSYKKEIEVIPNCVDVQAYENIHADTKLNQLVFTGSFRYHTNYEAMVWFVRDVFPRILRESPQTQLVITGDHAGLPLPPTTNVTLAGYVEDIGALIAASAVSLAPLWSGGGTRLKILEAMAIGTPVVATSKGAEGLDAKTGEHLFVTDSADQFADYVLQLLRERDLWHHLATNAKQLVQEKYDWGVVLPRFLGIVEQISRK